MLSAKYERKVSVEWFLRNPEWYLNRMLFPVKLFMACITFSITFEAMGSSSIGLKFLGSVLTLQSCGK